jgi:AsmA protein
MSRRGEKETMGRFFFAILALLVLLVAILIVAPGLVPVKTYKGRIEAAASNALGRNVTIGDDLSFKIIPRTAFHVVDLEVANAEGFDAPYLLRVKSADIGVKLLPLLKGSVEVDRFVLTEPDINLARAADGRVNWNLASAKAEETTESGEGTDIKDVQLGDVRIVDGKASFADAAGKRTYSMTDIDMTAKLASLSQPLEVDGTMNFEGAPSRVNIVLTTLRNVLDKEDANLKLDLALGSTEAGADLTVKTKEALSYSGPVKLDAPDLPAFATLLGSPLNDAPGFDKLAVEGVASGGEKFITLSGAKVNFDAIDAQGDLRLDWSGAKPKATGRLAAGNLDLRPYLPPPAPDAQGFPAWSEEKLDFTGLRNINADIDLSADKVFLNELEFGESRMKLVIEDGRMTADIPELGMYGGGGSGQLIVNARQATPALSGKFDVGSVDAQPFSMDLMKTDRLLGLGGFKLDFTASGSSQAAIMRSLDGAGGFDVADGALKGVNLGKLAAAIAQIQKGGLNPTAITTAIQAAQRPDEKTDFSELLSQFSIADGLVTSPKISMSGPFLTMTGAGVVNLPAQTLDLRLAPKATTTADGEGGQTISIPMRVTGTFSQPRIVIDAEALLRGRAEQGLKDILDSFGKKGEAGQSEEGGTQGVADQILKGVLGGQKPAPEEEEAPAEEPGAESAAAKTPESAAIEAIGSIFGSQKRTAPEAGEEPDDPN